MKTLLVIASIVLLTACGNNELLESRKTANEAAAAATLKAAIFSGQISFQAGRFNDSDENGIGRYGFIDELNGHRAVDGAARGELQFITGPLAQANNPSEAHGYYFKVYLPKGENDVYLDVDELRDATDKNEKYLERMFIVYAWPKNKESGGKIFALRQDGQLLTTMDKYDYTYDSVNLPPWDLIFGGSGDWNAPLKGWTFYY